MSTAIFWIAALLIAFTFAFFPLIVLFRGWLLRRPYKTGNHTPKVSMAIPAYNEADSIGNKLDNIISLEYPADRREIVIASDVSTDDTNTIVSKYADFGVKLLALPRQGKAAALNAAVASTTGE